MVEGVRERGRERSRGPQPLGGDLLAAPGGHRVVEQLDGALHVMRLGGLLHDPQAVEDVHRRRVARLALGFGATLGLGERFAKREDFGVYLLGEVGVLVAEGRSFGGLAAGLTFALAQLVVGVDERAVPGLDLDGEVRGVFENPAAVGDVPLA